MKSIVRAAALAACAVMAASLGGCGQPTATGADTAASEAPKPAAAALPNACDVLDLATARKYLGETASLTRKYQPNPQMTQCQYGSDKGMITVMVGPWSMVHTASPVDKPVSGVGDTAVSQADTLYVRKGDNGVSVGVMIGGGGEYWGKAADDIETKTLAAETKVAGDLLGKL